MDSSNATSSVEKRTAHHPSGVKQPIRILSVVDVPFERNRWQPQTVLRDHHGEELDTLELEELTNAASTA
jgi:hypothetical protein